MQWLGDGVITIEKKDYGQGDVIPENKLSKDRIKKLTKDGLLGDIPKAQGKAESDPAVAAENANRCRRDVAGDINACVGYG